MTNIKSGFANNIIFFCHDHLMFLFGSSQTESKKTIDKTTVENRDKKPIYNTKIIKRVLINPIKSQL